MAYSRLLLLLLLIGATLTHLPQVSARPIAFWCNTDARQHLMMNFKLEGNCSDTLLSTVDVPRVGVNSAEYKNYTLQETLSEVLQNFQAFQKTVKHLSNQTGVECEDFLKRFNYSIKHYVMILKHHPQKNGPLPTPALPQKWDGTQKLSVIWKIYNRLVTKKLEAVALKTECSHNKKRSVRQL
ncbi:thrombopoietin isoform X2 [Gambusia affinis]|uniref:thrombopoietin isoform X2 n=1 Tax=Gambusia affinis TaxID=33528 RepID=UPI001CDBC736|nr:thrombopoietin isoform X2 [Gambusia affinis]